MNEVMNTESQLPAEQKLSQLAAEINAIKEQVRETVYLSTCRIGEKLLLAKGAVGHGNWGQWLKDNVDYSERTAQNIITIYKNFNNKETKLFGTVPDAELLGKLNQSQLLALSSIKDEEKREALVVVDNDNLKLAIGRKAINVRLASKLTRYKLEVKTMEDIQKEGNK